MRNNMIPYSVYLPTEVYEKIKSLAKERKASEAIRDAITVILENGNEFGAGYRKALEDVIKLVDNCKEIEHIAIRNKYLADVLIDQIKLLGEK